MCGIGGFLLNSVSFQKNPQLILNSMSNILKSRGPDNEGFWKNKKKGIYLFHRRLSILDLSNMGVQPMISQNKRYAISYNGEVYNYNELSEELKSYGIKFKSETDTEVILEGISFWGIEKTLKKLIGMFAIIVWDSKLNKLFLIRDRLGIKPLYWGIFNNNVIFGSTMDSLLCFPNLSKQIDQDSLALYLSYGYVPSNKGIYKNINKVEPGSFIAFDIDILKPEINYFWKLKDKVFQSPSKQFDNFNYCVKHLESLIETSVKSRMISDVPIGSFLSGGIDSSLVTAIMQKNSIKKVKTFSIGFEDKQFDEATDAKKIANHLNTEHFELYLNNKDILDMIPGISSIHDEPFYDSSSVPSFLLSKFCKENVTVALSGDGGDELFLGYNRYLWGRKISNINNLLPKYLRQIFSTMIKSIPQIYYDKLTYKFQKKFGLHAAGFKVHKLANCLTSNSDDEMYYNLVKHWDINKLSKYENKGKDVSKIIEVPENLQTIEQRMQYIDLLTYLSDDILTKVDRASMANSLEVRVPLIDHRIVETSWSIPNKFKIHNGKTKYILRKILEKYIPKKMFERPKMGFAIPLDAWLRHQLFDWSYEIIINTDWESNFGLDKNKIKLYWKNFLKFGNPSATHMWILITLGAWCQK